MHTDLCAKINAMYALLDSDANGSLSFEEFRDGCRKLTHNAETPISITPGDWQSLTTKGADFSAMDEDEAGGGGVGAEQVRGVTDVSRGCWIWSSNRGVSHGGCWICDLSLVSQESVISRWCHKKSL